MKLWHKVGIFLWASACLMGMLGGMSLLMNGEYGVGGLLLAATALAFAYGIYLLAAAATREQAQRAARVQLVLEQHGVPADKSQLLYQQLQYELHGFTHPREAAKPRK